MIVFGKEGEMCIATGGLIAQQRDLAINRRARDHLHDV